MGGNPLPSGPKKTAGCANVWPAAGTAAGAVLRAQLEAQEGEAGPTTAPPKAVGVDVSTQSDPASSLGSLWPGVSGPVRNTDTCVFMVLAEFYLKD